MQSRVHYGTGSLQVCVIKAKVSDRANIGVRSARVWESSITTKTAVKKQDSHSTFT